MAHARWPPVNPPLHTPAYRDRTEGGRQLAARLAHLATAAPMVLAIPRGGVETARPVADALGAPLDLMLVRKLPVPFAPETAFGVIAEDGTTILDEELVLRAGLSKPSIIETQRRVLEVLRRYAKTFDALRPRFPVAGRTVVLVDDGLATGYTMLGAVRLCRHWNAGRIVVAAPVASREAVALVASEADEIVCPIVDPDFFAVGAYYAHFPQVSDEDVRHLLFPQDPGHLPASVRAA